MHEIENVVAPESGTVEAPPESAVSLKLPSGLVTRQLCTFFDFQKIEVREPTGTDAGTAQISTLPAGPVVVLVDVAAVVVAVRTGTVDVARTVWGVRMTRAAGGSSVVINDFVE